MDSADERAAVDWNDCPLVEKVVGKVSGVPILTGTRLPADTVLENYDSGSSIHEIAENFDISEELVLDILNYAKLKRAHPQR